MKVFVKEGDKVNTGDNLLIYEAMKMENTLKSEKAGTIKSLSVKEGDAVLGLKVPEVRGSDGEG